jgi:capping protein beta
MGRRVSYYTHDSWDPDAVPTPESPTEEPLEIEGPGLGAKRYSSNPTLITPDRYLPKTRIRIMADPIDSALWVALHPVFPMFVANSSS